jgi:hypothetical protein
MLLNGPIGVEMEQPALPAQRRTKKEERTRTARIRAGEQRQPDLPATHGDRSTGSSSALYILI